MSDIEEFKKQYLREIEEIVDRHGWAVQGVGPDPSWAYTVGLNILGHPELVIVGLPMSMAMDILNRAARVHIDYGIVPGAPVDIDYSVIFQTRRIAATHLNVARAFQRESFQETAIQLVWPDEDGVYREDQQVIPD